MSLSRLSRLSAPRVARSGLLSSQLSSSRYLCRSLMSISSPSFSSSLPYSTPRTSATAMDEADAVCKGDYIHLAVSRGGDSQEQPSVAFTTLDAQPSASSLSTPLSLTLSSPIASTLTLTTASSATTTADSTSVYAWSASFSTDAEAMRRADDEYVLALFGAKLPDDATVREKRHQLSADQQTASRFAGTESTQSVASNTGSIDATSSSTPQPARKKNKAETKAEARKDRDQGEFDQTGQRVSRVSASQSVREMEEAGHKQAEHTKRGEQGAAKVTETVRDGKAERSEQQQQAPPRPLDNRRPGDETKDGAAPWSE